MPTKTISEKVIEFIETEALAVNEIRYFPPEYVRDLLMSKRQIVVNKMYIVRMYARMGIVYDDQKHAWLRNLKK